MSTTSKAPPYTSISQAQMSVTGLQYYPPPGSHTQSPAPHFFQGQNHRPGYHGHPIIGLKNNYYAPQTTQTLTPPQFTPAPIYSDYCNFSTPATADNVPSTHHWYSTKHLPQYDERHFSEPLDQPLSRSSSQASIFSNISPETSSHYSIQPSTTSATQTFLPSAREFMAGAEVQLGYPLQEFPRSVPRLPSLSSIHPLKKACPEPADFVSPSLIEKDEPIIPARIGERNGDDSLLQPSLLTNSEPIHPPEAIGNKRKINETDQPQNLPKRMKKVVSYKFNEDSNALFFSSIKIDYNFIVRHLARESEENTHNIDWTKPSQRLTISQDDLIRWTILEFLYNDIKIYDRRYDSSPLIHDTPQNRFYISIEFGLNRNGKQKNVTLSMTLLKPSSSKLTAEEVSKDLGRILAEIFLNHDKVQPGKKRRWSSARPQWGLGSDNELSIIELNFDIKSS